MATRKISAHKAPNPRFVVKRVDGHDPNHLSTVDGSNEVQLDPSQLTYAYDTHHHKSLAQMTREAYPRFEHYQNQDSVGNFALRPGMDELLHDLTFKEKKRQRDEDEDDEPALKGKVVKFTWLEGVLMRCLLNIWGVMLFLRLTWCIGQAGILEGLFIISLANLVTFITAFSMSAVSTNGQIKAGGIYYMISRSLGPEFGAAIGLMFTVANSIAVSLHIVGFCEGLRDLLRDYGIDKIIDGGDNDIRVIGLATLVFIIVLAFIGMDWVTRAQMLFLVILVAAQVDFVVGSFIGPVDTEEKAKGFIGYNTETFKTNFWNDYGTGLEKTDNTKQSFFTVFGVFFPSVTGIVAGANLSGDLKDPAGAIPKGTLLAITITYVSYVIYAVMIGGCALRNASGNVTEYEQTINGSFFGTPGFKAYTDCTDRDCDYGLFNSAQVMELISSWGLLIYMGCFAATLSSAIASFVGAPRVFQALCRDKLYPLIHVFAKGYGANNDPFRGYALVFIISLGCLLIAKLNVIAPFQANFFLMAYALINFTCFHSTIMKTPGWRPAFKYYNAWVSLAGSILCVAAMFLMSWYVALVTVGVVVALYLFVQYRKPQVNWGSSTQAQSYNSAVKSLQDLSIVEEHVKNYKPQVLVFSGMPSSRPQLVDFAYLITKDVSLMVCAQVVQGKLTNKIRNSLRRQADGWLLKHKRKGFYTVREDPSFHHGCQAILELTGLGKLRPNMVLLGYKQNWFKEDRTAIKEYFNTICEVLHMHVAVAILRMGNGLDYTGVVEEEDQFITQHVLQQMNKMIKKSEEEITGNQSEDGLSQDESDNETIESPPQSPDVLQQVKATSPVAPQFFVEDQQKKKKGFLRKTSASEGYKAPGGGPLSPDILQNVTHFRRKQTKGFIDVWWLYDDGGLTLLLPYILTTRSIFAGCTLRIFSLGSRKEDLATHHLHLANLLAKFRIDYSDIIVIQDITKKADPATKKEFDELIAPFKSGGAEGDGTTITDAELMALKERTNRHLRLRELLLEHSKDSTFIVMTLPIPRRTIVSAPLYMAWLEMMTKNMPPFLFVRGNQTPVITFYS